MNIQCATVVIDRLRLLIAISICPLGALDSLWFWGHLFCFRTCRFGAVLWSGFLCRSRHYLVSISCTLSRKNFTAACKSSTTNALVCSLSNSASACDNVLMTYANWRTAAEKSLANDS